MACMQSMTCATCLGDRSCEDWSADRKQKAHVYMVACACPEAGRVWIVDGEGGGLGVMAAGAVEETQLAGASEKRGTSLCMCVR